MRDSGILSIKQSYAADRIARPIFEGKFDYSKKEKFFYFFVAPIASAYASWESVKFYMELGGKGTKYLPIGTFSEAFGGQAAFWSNFSFNWFFMMDTLLSVRKAYYHHKYARKLGVATSPGKIIAKLSIAFILAAASGVVMSMIAGNEHGRYNQVETGLVNGLLNYLGSITLEVITVIILSKIKDSLYHCICKKAGLEEDEIDLDSVLSTEWLPDQFDERNSDLKKIKNEHAEWSDLKTFSGYFNFVLASSESSGLISNTVQKTPGKIERVIVFLLHFFLQIFDKISLFGYWQATMGAMQKAPFHIESKGWANTCGTLFFTPFVGLTTKVTYDTVGEIVGMAKSGYTNTKAFIKNPDGSKETVIKITAISLIALATLTGYFFAYVSSNSGLELNAEYGWNEWWNVYPTAMGTTVFNGFGFLNIFIVAFSVTIPYLIYSADKREVIHKHGHVTDFLKSYPKAVDQLAKEESIGLTRISIGQMV